MVITEKHFYEVSSLLYAIAISDVRLHQIEKDVLIKAITTYHELLLNEDQTNIPVTQEYGPVMFKTLSEVDSNAWELFNNFEKYYLDHQSEFNINTKQWIIAKANEIGSSYAGQNKSEVVLIARLRLLFGMT